MVYVLYLSMIPWYTYCI